MTVPVPTLRSRRGRLEAMAAVFLLVMLAGCTASGAQVRSSANSPSGRTGGTLTVLAAASLTDAFGELATLFQERNGVAVRISFASSSTLANQILRGAPGDVFASADRAQMDRVADSGLVAYRPAVFASTHLVVLVPDDNPAGIHTFEDLAMPGVRLVLAAEGVPAAEYAERVLTRATDRYGPRFRQLVLDNLVSREADVRAAVNRVVLGDADATFAYASDVTPEIHRRVRVIEIPAKLNVTATYHISALTGADSRKRARQWIDFVLSDRGQAVLRSWGFQPADSQ